MNATVRCAGGFDLINTVRPACGWKGERKTRIYAPITFTFHGGGKHVEDRWLAVDPTDKPCPRCGGRVELISAEVTP